jgi:hypothetical protein
MLAEASTTEISNHRDPKTLDESKEIAQAWWGVAKSARKSLEQQTGKSIISWKGVLE